MRQEDGEKHSTRTGLFWGPMSLLVLTVAASAANAQPADAGRTRSPAASDAIEEVLVTAMKRGAASAQSLPLSISALSGKSLESAGDTVFAMGGHRSVQQCDAGGVVVVPKGLKPDEAVIARLGSLVKM